MNLFKTLAAAMLMPAMLLTTSCSIEDNALNNPAENTGENPSENTAENGYTLPVTVNVTRKGVEATTRTSFNSDTDKLEFTAGDKLFLYSSHATAGVFAGTLDYVSDGTFSGTINTENSYTGTADALFADATYPVAVTLLPKGYEDYGYLYIYDLGASYISFVSSDYSKAFALTKSEGVVQLSNEVGYGYSRSFDLAPSNAILYFTITGLTPGKEVDVALSGTSVTGKKVTTDASGTATFATALLGGYSTISDKTLTIDGHDFSLASESKVAEAGKIYDITRNVGSGGDLSRSGGILTAVGL